MRHPVARRVRPPSRRLVAAERKGLRTAFVINDSLTPSFGLQPSLFSDVVEPDGGWKYWFTLGYGTCWPAYSWIQNYFSPVETTNAWSDSEVFWRDLDRTLEGHHWVSSHDCELHVPITLKRAELQTLDPWRWLLHSAKAYHPYTTAAEINQDRSRLNWRADALLHYQIRIHRLIDSLAPHLEAWNLQYPQLSGVVTSDHGEEHVPLVISGKVVSHLNGLHGFLTNDGTL